MIATQQAQLSNEPKRCRHMCPGGNQCTCDAGIRHSYHICPNPACICHLVECYEMQAKPPRIPVQESQTA